MRGRKPTERDPLFDERLIQGFADDKPMKMIADEMGIQVATLRYQLKLLKKKHSVSTIAALVRIFIEKRVNSKQTQY